jgi:hypothetical protein
VYFVSALKLSGASVTSTTQFRAFAVFLLRIVEANNCPVFMHSGNKLFIQEVTNAAAVDLRLPLLLALNGTNDLQSLQAFTAAMFGNIDNIDNSKLITWNGL